MMSIISAPFLLILNGVSASRKFKNCVDMLGAWKDDDTVKLPVMTCAGAPVF